MTDTTIAIAALCGVAIANIVVGFYNTWQLLSHINDHSMAQSLMASSKLVAAKKVEEERASLTSRLNTLQSQRFGPSMVPPGRPRRRQLLRTEHGRARGA